LFLTQRFQAIARHQAVEAGEQQTDHQRGDGERGANKLPASAARGRVCFAQNMGVVNALDVEIYVFVGEGWDLKGVLLFEHTGSRRCLVQALRRHESIQNGCQGCHFCL
jgi:hypothetical protein